MKTLRFKYLASLILPVIVTGGSAQAQNSKADPEPLTVLGLYIGQSESESFRALGATEFKRADAGKRRSAGLTDADRRTESFETEQGDRLRVKLAGLNTGARAGRVVGIDYEPARADDGLALEARLKTKFGGPAVTYDLQGESRLYVWERPAPAQTKDFGPLLTVSLTTGDAPSLTMSQFSRPAKAASAAAPASRAASRRVRSVFTGPVD